MGDPAGVGPEIIVATWKHFRESSDHNFFVLGDYKAFQTECESAGLPSPIKISSPSDAQTHFSSNLPVMHIGDLKAYTKGMPSPDHSPEITGAIEKAVHLCLTKQAAGMVTAPISKENLYAAGFKYPGHTEFLAHLCEGHETPYPRGPVMLLEGGGLRCALVTIHMPLSEAISAITKDAITKAAETLYGALKIDYGLANPHIAMAGLNPHAGENGALGGTEFNIQNPAAKALRSAAIDISDARSADTLFHAEAREGYDAVLAMYHDQGLIPVKTLDFHGGVNITLGLPIIRTSPDHGTAFDIAGQGKARPDSLIAAIKKARQLADNRTRYAG